MEKRKRGRPRKNPAPCEPEIPKEPEAKEKNTEGRDSSGRFMPGYKGGGRKKKPKEIADIHKYTIPELIKIATDEKTNTKVRADILKWLTEMDIGRPKQQIDADVNDNKLEVEVKVI